MRKGASMAGKSGVFTVLLLVITAFAVAGCSSPVASIGQGVPRASYRGLLVEYQLIYNVGDDFELDQLKLFLIGGDGKKQGEKIGQDDYEVHILDKTGEPAITGPVTHLGYTFMHDDVGEMTILVEYNGHSIPCPIEVSEGVVGLPPGISYWWPENS
jgi:hypothetical protein